jgi:hypothetical protein
VNKLFFRPRAKDTLHKTKYHMLYFPSFRTLSLRCIFVQGLSVCVTVLHQSPISIQMLGGYSKFAKKEKYVNTQM